ncbi:MAG: hypothetical protein J0L92_17395 [Deltaproteobacteria bacterium]|nr:hypothetical protein [Deltaproteobacteria bacterium]
MHTPSIGSPSPSLARRARLAWLALLSVVALLGFVWPGLELAYDLTDPALGAPGIPRRAVRLHRDLTPRFADWAEARVATGAAADAPLHDVPTTEWPMFSAVFYLMGTRALTEAVARGELDADALGEPRERLRAITAARALLLDPVHHTWVRTHWGDDYLHEENVFFRSLLIGGLTADVAMTNDARAREVLRDQTDSLADDLDRSALGLLNDYPHECYPIDVLAAVGWIRRADAVLGTDHRAFAERAIRAFEGENADHLGLPRFRVLLPSGREVQPSRGIGTSWSLLFARELWPDRADTWYATYERHFFRDHGWAAGFREYEEGTEAENTFEIDAGPVIDGFGTAASAFGIAAARRNGRFDHAYTLSTELAAASWALPDGRLVLPRLASHAIDAPYLGESAILYFLTVQPAEGVEVRTGGHAPWCVWLAFLVYFGLPLALGVVVVRELRRTSPSRSVIGNRAPV